MVQDEIHERFWPAARAPARHLQPRSTPTSSIPACAHRDEIRARYGIPARPASSSSWDRVRAQGRGRAIEALAQAEGTRASPRWWARTGIRRATRPRAASSRGDRATFAGAQTDPAALYGSAMRSCCPRSTTRCPTPCWRRSPAGCRSSRARAAARASSARTPPASCAARATWKPLPRRCAPLQDDTGRATRAIARCRRRRPDAGRDGRSPSSPSTSRSCPPEGPCLRLYCARFPPLSPDDGPPLLPPPPPRPALPLYLPAVLGA